MTLFSLMCGHVESQIRLMIELSLTDMTGEFFDALMYGTDVIPDESALI